jgi:hypothetical protein
VSYLSANGLLPRFQSAYRSGHSTETAVTKVLSDILTAIDSGDISVLALLDLSAAFDTVDHRILLMRMQTSLGVSGPVLAWFMSYLTDRTQYVRLGSRRSPRRLVKFGVPQGSVLGPILFLLYTVDLPNIIEAHGLQPHIYADDTQIYGDSSPSAAQELQQRLSVCMDDVAKWMRSNRLQLNASKTEILWCGTARRQHQLPTAVVRVGADFVAPSVSVRDLGIYLDADVSMSTHVTRTVSRCFAALRQLRTIRRSVPTSCFQSLVVSLVLSRLDYGNATLVGLPAFQYQRLQSVMNAGARLIFGAGRRDHVTPLLRQLHWLRAEQRVIFKVAMLAYQCIRGVAPSYLSDSLHLVADMPGRSRLRSASTLELVVPLTRLSTVGDRSFPVAAAKIWNSLPHNVTKATSLLSFRKNSRLIYNGYQGYQDDHQASHWS